MKNKYFIRLSKALAAAGVASRRDSENLISAGRVAVNGTTVTVPQTMVEPGQDKITVDGKETAQEEKVYYIVNKPANYLCSHERRSKRAKLIYDLFPGEGNRLFSAGRLDKDTEGLLVVTNDGQFANRIIHPSANINKEYVAKTGHEITEGHLKTISDGIVIDGRKVIPAQVSKIRRGTIKVIVKEGKKHEVRLLLEAAGLEVHHLKRTRIGGLRLNSLPVGSWRKLTETEKRQLLQE